MSRFFRILPMAGVVSIDVGGKIFTASEVGEGYTRMTGDPRGTLYGYVADKATDALGIDVHIDAAHGSVTISRKQRAEG